MAEDAEMPQMLEPPDTMEELNQLLSVVVNAPYRDLRLTLLDASDEFRDLERSLLLRLTEERGPLPAQVRTDAVRLVGLMNAEVRTVRATQVSRGRSAVHDSTVGAVRSLGLNVGP